MPEFIEVLGKNAVNIRLDQTIYPAIAIAKAAFRYADRVACLLGSEQDDSDSLCCLMISKHESTDLREVVISFMDELLDQKIRMQLEEQFHDVRLLITAQAFAEGNLLNPEDDSVSYESDPRSVGVIR